MERWEVAIELSGDWCVRGTFIIDVIV